jgi:hypothetical protein
MDFIKKHYEKIALAGALLALIASAVFLAIKVSALSEEVEGAIHRKPKGRTLEPGDVGLYTNAIARILQPPLWTDNNVDMFRTGEIDITPKTTDGGTITPTLEPYRVLEVTRRPFKLIFKSYTGDGHNFQINFVTHARTFFIAEVGMEIADKFGNTGYVIKKFERKQVTQQVPGVGPREVDVSELTIQRNGDDPIVLPYNRLVEEKEPVATIQCTDGGRELYLSRQQEFSCGSKTYIVVDITPTQVIIMDKLSKEKRTHSVSGIGRPLP